MIRTEQKKSRGQIEAEIQRIKAEEKVERVTSLFIPLLQAALITAGVLFLFNTM